MTAGRDPWVVEVTRGGVVESAHRVTVVVLDAAGAPVVGAGEVDRPVFGRSSLKPAQAVAVLGHAAAAGRAAAFTDAELALAAGSHSGERTHRAAVTALLARHGLGVDALRCPPDLPLGADAARDLLAAGGSATPVAMNCSGKHAAMLVATGGDPAYLDPAHPLQVRARDAVEDLAGPVLAASVDGCGAPALATTVRSLARLARALGHAPCGSPAARVAAAMAAHPHLVGGTGRLDTVLMGALPGAVAKSGAEGVHVLALPGGPAAALKVDDGAGRAVGPAVLGVLATLGIEVPDAVAAVASPPVTGGGRPVGTLRVRS